MAKNDTVFPAKGNELKASDIIRQHKRMAMGMGMPVEPVSKAPTKKTPA